jgi:hypothetical protein
VEGLWSTSHSDCFTPREGALNVHWIEGKVSYRDSLAVVAEWKKKIRPCQESNSGYPTCNQHVTNLAIVALQITPKICLNPQHYLVIGLRVYEVVWWHLRVYSKYYDL